MPVSFVTFLVEAFQKLSAIKLQLSFGHDGLFACVEEFLLRLRCSPLYINMHECTSLWGAMAF